MATNDKNVNINVTATNRASGVMDQVKGSLKSMESAASVATKGIAGIAGAFAIGAVTQVAGQVANAIGEMANLAAASEQVGASFDQLAAKAGQSSAGLLNSLKAASRGTISEYDLMLAANRSMLLGVADSSEEMTGLMNIAISRGRAMGLSTTQAFNDLVTGLGRASPMILDNLGITINAEEVNKKYAASLGKTAEALTEAERKQALVNEVMKEAESVDLGNVDTMASSFERAQAAMSDMKVALGELFGPAIAVIAENIAKAATAAKEMGETVKEVFADPTITETLR
jgi:hypothetical protein